MCWLPDGEALPITDLCSMAYPMIITLELEKKAQAYFTDMRKQYFPAHSNYLEAHLTLFHKLPSDVPELPTLLQAFSPAEPLSLWVNGLVHWKGGVAFTLTGEPLLQLHRQLQQAFDPWLIRRDREPLRPHITIQNKVTAFRAQQLYDALRAEFRPFEIKTTAFATWLYLGGPWKPINVYPFAPVPQ